MSRARTLVVLALSVAAAGCGNKKPGEATDTDAGADAFTPPVDNDVDDDFPLPLAAGLAPTPPMGWNSWNKFACNVSETIIKQVADGMVAYGMKDAGYQYINIDDCWAEVNRNADGTVQPAAANFPNGIAPVADYVHSKGLKLGIYSDRGTMTCGGRAGSQDHEMQDAMTYASWGVDYVKYDNCYADMDPTVQQTQYTTMGDALKGSGRDIVFSLCAWNFYEWGIGVGQLWRTTTDIKDTWDSVYANYINNQMLAAYAGPNGWNDADMLEVGNGGLTPDEERTHFSLWALAAAPLIAGNDLRPNKLSDDEKAILTNADVIALNQDALGLQGALVRKDQGVNGELSVWAKPLNENGARGVVLLNASDDAADIAFTFTEIGLRGGFAATVRDLWAHTDLGYFQDGYTVNVPSHGVAALRVKGAEPSRPSGSVFLSDLTWTYAANGLGPVEKDQNNGASAAGDGTPIALRGQTFSKGLGMSAPSAVIFRMAQACTTFTATVGVDDLAKGSGSVVFQVFADGDKLFDSGVVTGTSDPVPVSVDVTGRRRLRLQVTNAGDGAALDRASWGDAKLDCGP
jgi:alpha-galactosidase